MPPSLMPEKGPRNPNPLPSPSLPKGGGAIRDVGEKFSANPATGAGSFSVPVFTSPGRGGFHPELTLQYDSGKGSGPFGIGWSLSVPRITRRTDKGLPRYFDDGQGADTFILSGAEDLVPALHETSSGWVRDELPAADERGAAYRVLRYRPRVEALYARIERWTRQSDGDVHWRSITKDNISSVYGRSPPARIIDPADRRRVFSWLLEETRDGKGNIIAYEYQPEDQQNINRDVGIERKRPVANVYPKRVYYGNQMPDVALGWHFQVLLDYGEHDARDPVGGPLGVWPGRQDPFSDFRSTFEVRTYRLCRRILMLHNFAELGADWTVVRSTDLTFDENPISTYLRSVNGSPTATPPVQPSEIDFSDTQLPAAPARRLFERTRPVFLGEDPVDNKLLARGLLLDTRRAALTPTLVDNLYQALVPDPNARNQLLVDNKYLRDDGLWWMPSGLTSYSESLFYQPQQFTDPFGNVSTVAYDAYALLVKSATTAAGTPVETILTAESDYRVLAPSLLTDANANRTQAAFDALGRVTATYLIGKVSEVWI